jgi:hypothetical protein
MTPFRLSLCRFTEAMAYKPIQEDEGYEMIGILVHQSVMERNRTPAESSQLNCRQSGRSSAIFKSEPNPQLSFVKSDFDFLSLAFDRLSNQQSDSICNPSFAFSSSPSFRA